MRLMIFVGLLTHPLAAADVPVPNGGFEQGLDGWSLIRPEGFAHGQVTSSEQAHGGRRAVRVVNPAGDKVMVGLINAGHVPLPAEARNFRVSFWIRAATAPAMVELRIASTDASGKALSPWNEHGWRFVRPPVGPMVGDWFQVKAGFGAQEDWGGVQFTIWINGPGADVLVDDVEITTVDPEELAVPSVGARVPAEGAAAWWEGPLRKVYPDAQPPAATALGIDLAACGGEREAVQLCLRPEQAARGVNASFSDLRGPGTIPAAAWQANWVGLVPVTKALSGWSRLGPTPDPLLPEPTCDLPAGETRAVWLTLNVPRGTPPGDYQGSIKLAGGSLSAEVPVKLHVYGFDLPEQSSLRTISRIWQSHDGYYELFRQNIAEHRAGGTSSIGGIVAKREGERVVVDAAGLPKAVAENLTRYGSQVFNVPHVYLGDNSGLYNKEGKWFGFDVFTPEFDRAFTDYCRQVGDALRAAGVMQYALWQVWDEPHGELIDKCIHLAKLIKEAAPEARIYLTMAIEPRLLDYVGIWNLPWPNTWDESLVAEARRRGAHIWAYENERYTLDTADSSLQMRGYLWRLKRYGIQGVEWWAISSWKSDPWTVPNQYAPQNGGGFFLYPTADRKGAPINSLRWEMYREGVEDYDLLTLLREAEAEAARAAGRANPEQVADAAVQALASQVALNVAEVSPDPRLMDQLKRQTCERIEALKRGR